MTALIVLGAVVVVLVVAGLIYGGFSHRSGWTFFVGFRTYRKDQWIDHVNPGDVEPESEAPGPDIQHPPRNGAP